MLSYLSMPTLPNIKLENFEGPFDLLLELAQQRRLDVTSLSLRQITDDFLAYVKSGECTPELLGDFLVVAATLLLLKVRQLLPRLSAEEDQEVASLTQRLAAYQPFREVAEQLRTRWGKYVLMSGGGKVVSPFAYTFELPEGALTGALDELLVRLPKPIEVRAHLRPQGRSLAEWLALFTERLRQLEQLVFQKAVRGSSSQDVAISFLAVLELARKQEIILSQSALHEDLVVRKV